MMAGPEPITAAIIGRDAAEELPGCLASVSWCDRTVVFVDDRTIDGTANVATGLGAQAISRAFDSWAGQRNAALDHCSTEWVLFVDVDERVTPGLQSEIVRALRDDQNKAGYWLPRFNFMFGRWVRYGGWYPDYQLRLLRRGKARYDTSRPVHEIVLVEGETGHFSQPLLHNNYDSVEELLRRQVDYAPYDADRLRQNGPVPAKSLMSGPVREFFRRYYSLGGVFDGPIGLLLAVALAWNELLVRWMALLPRRPGA